MFYLIEHYNYRTISYKLRERFYDMFYKGTILGFVMRVCFVFVRGMCPCVLCLFLWSSCALQFLVAFRPFLSPEALLCLG